MRRQCEGHLRRGVLKQQRLRGGRDERVDVGGQVSARAVDTDAIRSKRIDGDEHDRAVVTVMLEIDGRLPAAARHHY